MKPIPATFALIALAVATAGFAQTAPPPDPQPGTTPPQEQQQQPQPDPTTQPSDPGTDNAATQALMKDCMTKVQAANPNAPQEVVKDYCVKEVSKQTGQPSPHD